VREFPGQNIPTAFERNRINFIIDRMLVLLWKDPLVNARLAQCRLTSGLASPQASGVLRPISIRSLYFDADRNLIWRIEVTFLSFNWGEMLILRFTIDQWVLDPPEAVEVLTADSAGDFALFSNE
jgi:hypothetical protein